MDKKAPPMFEPLEKISKGINPGELVLFGAGRGSGKTCFVPPQRLILEMEAPFVKERLERIISQDK